MRSLSKNLLRIALLLTTALLIEPAIGTGALFAQQSAALDKRIPTELRPVLQAILDSAADAGLPTASLADKALEGVSKKADGDRVVSAVRALYQQLKTVQQALDSVSAAELDAATVAYRAGTTTAMLKTVQSSLPKRSLVVPYGVLGTLVQRGVPVSDAVNAVVKEAKRRKDDQSLLALSTALERNIAAGLPARTALIRAQKIPDAVIDNERGGTRRP